jgi:molybdopterin-biosynthesis enzyme MoeA-like protein
LLLMLMLPGVPYLLRQKWAAVSLELQAAVQLAPFSNRVVRLAAEDEAAVAPLLDTLAAEWGGELAIGSYPVSFRVHE